MSYKRSCHGVLCKSLPCSWGLSFTTGNDLRKGLLGFLPALQDRAQQDPGITVGA